MIVIPGEFLVISRNEGEKPFIGSTHQTLEDAEEHARAMADSAFSPRTRFYVVEVKSAIHRSPKQ